jgi:hypothetical protein
VKCIGIILNDVRCEANRYFRNRKREYLKGRINELAMNSKNKNITDLSRGHKVLIDFKIACDSLGREILYCHLV